MPKSGSASSWTIRLNERAARDFGRLDRQTQRRIADYLQKRVAANPRNVGKPLHGTDSGLWGYRVGDYRIICRIEDERVTVLVVRMGHRREVYRR